MAVNLHASHFRFGVDELAESTHGWHAAEDANPAQGVIPVNVTFLLRFTVQETGGTAAANVDQQFQCRKNGGTWQDITTISTIVKAVAAAALTNGGNCTKRLGGTGTFESTGAGQTEDGLSGGNANDIAASGNSETECGLQLVGADVAGGDVLEFRLTSPDFTITNDVIPALTVQGATIIEADGASAGNAASSIDGRAVFAGVMAAAGAAVASVVGAVFWLAVVAAVGTGTPVGVGAAFAAGQGVAAGVASDAGISGAIAQTDATSAGSGTAQGISPAPPVEADGASVGSATASGFSVAVVLRDGSAGGVGSLAGAGAAIAESMASAAGNTTATAEAGGPGAYTGPMLSETFALTRFR